MTRLRTDRHSDTIVIRSRAQLIMRILLALCISAALAQFAHVALGRSLPAAQAPDFVLRSLGGHNIRLSEYRSDVVVIAFWASWCGQCRESLPALESLKRAHAAEGFEVLAVSFDESAAAAAETARATGLSVPVLLDAEGETGRLYAVGRLPLLVLVDREGRLRGRFEGARSATALTGEIGALLSEP